MNAKLTLEQLTIDRLDLKPTVAVVVGSGIRLPFTVIAELPYASVPIMPVPRTEGHQGLLQVVRIGTLPVLVFCGRPHGYEGYSPEELCRPHEMAQEMGITHLLLTNAVGSLQPALTTGTIVQANDIICQVPWARYHGNTQPRQTTCLDTNWQQATIEMCLKQSIDIRSGVYVQTTGPQYETRAEIAMFRKMGADIIGMSSGFEAIEAARLGMHVQILSLVTNVLTTTNTPILTHDHVLATAASSADAMSTAIQSAIFAVCNMHYH